MKKNIKKISFFVLSLLLLFVTLGINTVASVPVLAETSEELYTVRVYSVSLSEEDSRWVTGIHGQKYSVDLWQNQDEKISLSLYYGSEYGKIFLSVKAGEKRGSYLEFKLKKYSALETWRMTYDIKTYIVSPTNIELDISFNGSFFETITMSTSVYDANDKGLYYLPDNTVVNSEGELIYNEVGGEQYSVKYDHKTKSFKDEGGNTLEVSKNKGTSTFVATLGNITEGVEKNYLYHRDQKMMGVHISEEIYKLKVKSYGRADSFYILCKAEKIPKVSWFWYTWQRPFLSSRDQLNGTWYFYDLKGYRVDIMRYEKVEMETNLVKEFNPWGLVSIFGGSIIQYKIVPFATCTFGDLVKEKIELGVDGAENLAVNVSTGSVIYDDLMNPICKDELRKQLIDIMDWPLIDSDFRPCYYTDDGQYYSYDGKIMTINEQKQLVDSKGKVIHSVVDEFEIGYELFFPPMKDGKALIPAFLKGFEGEGENKKAIYTDLAGNIINDIIRTPNLSESYTIDDRDFLQKISDMISGFLDKCIKFFEDAQNVIIFVSAILIGAVLLALVVWLIISLTRKNK